MLAVGSCHVHDLAPSQHMTDLSRIDLNRLTGAPKLPLPRVWPAGTSIAGRHMRLEKLDPARHADSLWQAAAMSTPNGRAVWDYLPDGPFETAADYRQFLDGLAPLADPFVYAVVLPDGRAVGTLALMAIQPAQGMIEIGYVVLSPALQRTTAATEAFFALMDYAISELGYRRLEWKCHAGNARSIKAAHRLGYAYEGLFFQHRMVKGQNRDTAWFSITDHEWPLLRPAFLQWLAPENFDAAGKPLVSLHSLTSAIRLRFAA